MIYRHHGQFKNPKDENVNKTIFLQFLQQLQTVAFSSFFLLVKLEKNDDRRR
jgi:hypothetical protein